MKLDGAHWIVVRKGSVEKGHYDIRNCSPVTSVSVEELERFKTVGGCCGMGALTEVDIRLALSRAATVSRRIGTSLSSRKSKTDLVGEGETVHVQEGKTRQFRERNIPTPWVVELTPALSMSKAASSKGRHKHSAGMYTRQTD